MPFLSQLRATPNLVTMLRLFVLPFLVDAILHGEWTLAFVLMILAGLSDALDGMLARRLNQQTKLGLYLDPIADKLLLSTLFITLTIIGNIPRYVTSLVFSRDLGILLIASVLFFTHTLRDFRPSHLGKIHTFIQIVAVGLLMASHVFTVPYLLQIVGYMLVVIAILAPISAAQYAWIVFRRLQTATPQSL